MSELFHCIVGLPRSGKTTFLAALWYLIGSGEVPTSMVLEHYSGDYKYINALEESWLKCEEMPRTSSLAGVGDVNMLINDKTSGNKITLRFPDLAGEVFEAQIASRSCSESYFNYFSLDGGILLFVNADRKTDGLTHLDLAGILGGDFDEGDQGLAVNTAQVDLDKLPAGEQEAEISVEWSAKLIPEQVQLVELLQFLQRKPFVRKARKLAIIVSAWDIVSNAELDPSAWLKREFPLLYQFVESNPDSFEFRVYGVSAQGGPVTGSKRAELLQMVPSTRIRCVGPGIDGHDITTPLVWLSGPELSLS